MTSRTQSVAVTVTVIAVAMLLYVVGDAAAAPITSDLNCAIGGSGCTSTSSFGTFTFSNVSGTTGGDVHVALDLTGTVNKILAGFLNYDFVEPASTLSVSGATTSMTVASDGINAGSCIGCFDIQVPGHSTTGVTDKAAVTFHSSAGALHVSDFLFPNVEGLDAAVHIGNIGPGACSGASCVPGTPGTGDVFAGERVPEPSSTLLLLVAGVPLVLFGRFAVKR